MRPGLSFFVALTVFFACVQSSPIRSSSTSLKSTRPDQHDVPVQRSLRNGRETSEEERAIFGLVSSLEKPKQLAEDVLVWALQLRPKKFVGNSFTFLRLHKAGEKLLRTVRYKAWVRYVAKHSDSIPNVAIKTVLKHDGANGLLKMFEDFAKAEASKAVLTTLESALMAIWRLQNISVDDVFKLLKLDQRIDDPLFDILLRMWVKFVNENTSVPDIALGVVIGGYDVIPYVKILDRLREIEGTEGAVKRLQESVLESLLQDGKSADDAFTALGLDRAGDKLFSDPKFEIWFQFVVKGTGTLPEAALTTVLKHYSDEYLLKMFEAFGTKPEANKAVLTTLESALMAFWKRQNISVDDVFKLLKLDQRIDDPLFDILLRMWVKFVNKSTSLPDIALRVVIGGYDVIPRVKILDRLREIEGTEGAVKRLQESVLESLLQDGKSADDAFTALGLDRAGDKLFSDPKFEIWFQFVVKGTGTLPEAALTTVLKHYSDEYLLKMFEAFGTKPEANKAVLTTLESALMAFWKRQNISVDDVFKLLKLDQRIDDPLFDILLRIWVKFVNKSTSLPDIALRVVIGGYDVIPRVKILDRLREIEGTEGAVKRLQESVLESLLQDGKSADDAFTALGLDRAGDKLFSDPKFEIWFQFVVKGTGTLPEAALTTVLKHYSDEYLLKMFEAFGTKPEASKAVLTTLESALMASWKDQGMSVVAVFKLLKLDQKNGRASTAWRGPRSNKVESKFGVWVQYAAKETNKVPKSTIKMVLEHYGVVGLLKMFEAFAKAEASKAVLTTLESTLMAFWKDKKMSAKNVFKLLRLDQQADDPLYDKLLRMWVDYVKKSFNLSILEMTRVIVGYRDIKTRVMILGGLRKIEGTGEVVKPLEYLIVQRLQKREVSFKDQVVQVFKDLNLQKDLKTLLQNPNLGLFSKFAAKFEPETSKEEALITASREVYGDIPLGKMLEATCQNNDATATLLRTELSRQRKQKGHLQ